VKLAYRLGVLNLKTSGYLSVAIAAVIWGSNGVIVNWIPLNAYVIAFFRVLFASLSLLPVVFLVWRFEALKAAQAWRTMLTLGALLGLGWGFLFSSMKLIAIANAVLLNYMAPIFTAILAPIFLKEKIERNTIVALAISMMGVMLISYQDTFQDNLNILGVVFGLLAGFAYAGFIILSKKAMNRFPSYIVAFYSYLATIPFLIPFLIGIDLSMNLTSWILLIILGSFNTGFAVTLYLYGLRLIKAQKAVIFTYLEPTSAMIFGFIFLGQQPTYIMLTGGFLILLAGYIVASK